MIVDEKGIINLENELAQCKISLFGANLLSYRPKNAEYDVFWLGELNKFDNVQAIRGGVPVCWPRFAEEKLNADLPRHGFARLTSWQLKNIVVENRKIAVELCLVPDLKFKVPLIATLRIEVTDKLEYSLETVNTGASTFNFSEALHAYFNVGRVDEIEIVGLAGCQYKKSGEENVRKLTQNLKIDGEFDAAFLQHRGPLEIIDPILNRVISIEKIGSDTTVVWNPAKDLAEMSPGQYAKFVCVESANQGESYVRLPAGEKHTISMKLQVRKFK